MNTSKSHNLRLLSALAFALAFSPIAANAVDTVTINANMETISAVAVTKVTDMEFGLWNVVVSGGDTPAVVMDTAGAMTTTGVTTSILIPLSGASGTAGAVTADVPAGLNGYVLDMQRSAITNFPGPSNMSLGSITYASATETGNNALVATTNQPVTVVTGGTPESVTYGGTVTFSATPTDGAHAASFDVTFAY